MSVIKKLLPYIGLSLVAIVLAISLAYLKNSGFQKPVDLSHLGGEFTLQGAKGEVKLSDFKGRPVILYFGFTTCPDVCPLALHSLNKTLDKMGWDERKKFVKIFISVDYKRDKPKKCQEYAEFFADDIIGLTGNKKQIEEVTAKYKVFFKFVELKDSAIEYTVDHSSRYYLIDQNGKLINTYSDINKDNALIKDLRNLR